MTDRDTFAAAALTGLLDKNDAAELKNMAAWWPEFVCSAAYRWADAMLRERASRTGQKIAKFDSLCAVCPERESTNLDAAPAARANAESVAPQPTAGDRSGNPTSHSGTGKQPAPPSVETDGFSSGSRSGQINRTPERESPRRECGESSLRDVARPDTKGKAAGGPEHHISEAETDALEFVVEEGRIANIHDYGILRSLLVRLRPEWEFDRPQPIKDDLSDRSKPVKGCVSDRSKPINDERLAALEQLSALDQKLERECGLTGNPMIKTQERTRPPHTTPTQGSVPCEGSVPDSRTENEPVAWAVAGDNGDYAVKLCFDKASAQTEADRRGVVGLRPDYVVVPLYRHPQPTLTDEERAAMRTAAGCMGMWMLENGVTEDESMQRSAATLRGLLDRLK